ncbi:hypothetical protein BU24DRAFT_488249 [Aaosphaeria arxii CBS 175.79]|uniref:Zn(2)-C6 fungal-type domain-containing protein n=1 Tax=Aaosphaeria arxii CBS 175.79 TaxID=1450172 RepID=A0A6A5YA85_9PLEO|nr:uncharacterized protein BU24DRAFT_488249 [Aaosphaeria arxii CBS 175.79]KAF2021927.1 hypothetical protein BU24DRAFT_488249 [Aaosphaeria arxii CBS 175.79]
MAEQSPSNSSDATAVSASPPQLDHILPRPPIKRARPQLSCAPCRLGKLKCNREHPVCDQCIKRARHDECKYVPPPPKNKQAQNMRGRIRNLENLVVSLMNEKGQCQKGGAGETTDETKSKKIKGENKNSKSSQDGPNVDSFGKLHITSDGSETYVGAGHWTSLLQEIEEVKESLDEQESSEEPRDEDWDGFHTRSTVTFGIPKPVTKAMLIQEMPVKDETDRLLSLWFNSADPLLFLIHAPTFQEEYKQFWKDPTDTPIMWIALLYCIMAMGIIVGPRNPGMVAHTTLYGNNIASMLNKADDMSRAINRFQQLASSAIVLADMVKTQSYMLETLMLYSCCEFLRRDDLQSKVWLMNGVALRVAMRMGYHRDPSNFTNISPFHGEMRRRIWHVLNMWDTLISFAIGLPTLIRRVESDVRAPMNLQDSDLSPDMPALPPARPVTEVTPALYTISKFRICCVFAEAAELSQKITAPSHSDIMILNDRLEEAHANIPDVMRVKPMDECITEQPFVIMGRFNVELLYQKTRIVLHRNYLTAGQSDPKFLDSRNICLNSAEAILQSQQVIYHACQPGGQLNKVWWYMSSLNTYDFLLAAMILCLELNHLQATNPSSPRVRELFGILENTHTIWTNYPNRFREASRGAGVLRAMLQKTAKHVSPKPDNQTTSFNGFDQYTGNTPLGLSSEAMGMLGESLPPQHWASMPTSVDLSNIPSEIDWTLWDSTMQGQSNILPNGNWASPPHLGNAATHSWLDLTNSIDTTMNPALDFSDPFNWYPSDGYMPPSTDMGIAPGSGHAD